MIHDILTRTLRVIEEVGDYQLVNFRTDGLSVETKFNINDVVTNVDKKSEEILLDYIRKNFPTHSIITEESGSLPNQNSEFTWIIDPLDGTANYSTGLPNFSISVALKQNDKTVLGIVYAPYLKELFYAILDGGAFFNGKPISVSECKSLAYSTVATGFPVDKNHNPDNNIAELSRVLPQVRAVRRLGSAAIDICYVAAGFLQAYWEMNLHIWDIAAAELILNEAGGKLRSYRDDRNLSVIASSPILMDKLYKLIVP